MKRAYKFYKNYEYDKKDRLCLSRYDQKMITNFANDVEYNLEDDLSDDVQDLLWTLYKYKSAHLISSQIYQKRMQNKKEILNILQHDDLKSVINLFLDEKNAEYVLKQLNYVCDELKNYKYGNTLKKDIHKDGEEVYISHSHSLSQVRIMKRFSSKDKLKYPSLAYKELYRMIFIEREIPLHSNVKKLRELIDKIFKVTIKDANIKKQIS